MNESSYQKAKEFGDAQLRLDRIFLVEWFGASMSKLMLNLGGSCRIHHSGPVAVMPF
jgi:hypothetical protein